MPSYTIDASNNTEPLDTRYVADFPAELRAMKSRMNQAINDQGQLSGGLKTDGTNYMTGPLGVGVAAASGKMLDILGDSKFTGDMAIAGSLSLVDTGFYPLNAGVTSAAHKQSGDYGGGMVFIAGAAYTGIWSEADVMCFGSGTATGLTHKLRIGASDLTSTGATSHQVIAKALGGAASFYALSSGTNSAHLVFGNTASEKGRISVDTAGGIQVCTGSLAAPALAVSPTKNVTAYGEELNAGGAVAAGQKRLAMQSPAKYAYICMNMDGTINLRDNSLGLNRWTTDELGDFTVARNHTILGAALTIGAGGAGDKSITLSNAVRGVSLELPSDGSYFRLVDYAAGVVRWTTDVAGNFTAAGNVFAYSDAKLKHDIVRIPDALARLKTLRGVNFKWNRDDSTGIGFIAQEVEAVFPELIQECADVKTVAYGNMTAVLVEAVNELSAQITELKLEVARLRGDV